MTKTILISNDLTVGIKVAHCDCGERTYKRSTTDAEIRKDAGRVCADCGERIQITNVPAGNTPAPIDQQQLERDMAGVCAWLGI